jgi:hypothetical protein
MIVVGGVRRTRRKLLCARPRHAVLVAIANRCQSQRRRRNPCPNQKTCVQGYDQDHNAGRGGQLHQSGTCRELRAEELLIEQSMIELARRITIQKCRLSAGWALDNASSPGATLYPTA